MLGDVLGGPGGEVGVEEALISPVEGTLFTSVCDDGLEINKINLLELIENKSDF